MPEACHRLSARDEPLRYKVEGEDTTTLWNITCLNQMTIDYLVAGHINSLRART